MKKIAIWAIGIAFVFSIFFVMLWRILEDTDRTAGSAERNIVTSVVLSGVLVSIVLLAFWLFEIPYRNALRRGHPNAEAIRICGLVGVLVFPFWFVALVWSFMGADRRKDGRGSSIADMYAPKGSSVAAIDRTIDQQIGESRPGTFEVSGVDRDTRMDTRLVIDADSPENARAKAELQGVVVTKVRHCSKLRYIA